MRSFIRNYKLSVPIAIGVLGGIAWLAFGYFGVHLLFVDDRVDEAVPIFDAPAAAADATDTVVPSTDTAEPAPTARVPSTPETSGVTSDSVAPVTEPPTSTPATDGPVDADPQIVTEYVGTFESRAHPTSGTALVLGNGTGQRFLRFEGFETDNGPDLNVYLVNSSAGDTFDFVDLGNLKGNIGDQNYEIPSDVDLGVYDTVSIWCVRFSSGFGEAVLAAA